MKYVLLIWVQRSEYGRRSALYLNAISSAVTVQIFSGTEVRVRKFEDVCLLVTVDGVRKFEFEISVFDF